MDTSPILLCRAVWWHHVHVVLKKTAETHEQYSVHFKVPGTALVTHTLKEFTMFYEHRLFCIVLRGLYAPFELPLVIGLHLHVSAT